MSTFLDIDSTYRRYDTYPNPCSYVVEAEQISSWNKEARQVTAHNSRPGSRMLEFSQSLQVKELTLPYTAFTYVYPGVNPAATIVSHTADLQRIYLDIHTLRYDDSQLINSIENKIPKARFVMSAPHIQYDSTGTPKWVHFSARIDQAMRFARNEPFKIEIMQEEGYVINITDTFLGVGINLPDPPPIGTYGLPTKSLQTYISVEVTPYFRDAHYANHELGYTQL